jgi:hypothetical protein
MICTDLLKEPVLLYRRLMVCQIHARSPTKTSSPLDQQQQQQQRMAAAALLPPSGGAP